MKNKINQTVSVKDDRGAKSDLYTRHKFAFDKILRLDTIVDQDFYQADVELDQELLELYDDDYNSISILIGNVGIGKSTSLRKNYGYENAIPQIQRNKKTIIFPNDYNKVLPDTGEEEFKEIQEDSDRARKIKNEFASKIESVCMRLEDEFTELKNDFRSDEGTVKFYNYMMETNPQALTYVPHSKLIGLTDLKEKEIKLDYAKEKEWFIYAATMLKYYLSSDLCMCDRIIVILDNIEPLPYNTQMQLIMQYLRFSECMNNRPGKGGYKNFSVNIIIAMRPHTYRIILENKAFMAYSIKRLILKNRMIDLSQYFDTAIDHYSKDITVEKRDQWEEACKITKKLSHKFNNQYANMIKNLVLWNTREAIVEYINILSNRVWIQRNMEKTGSFSVCEENFVFNNITVVRSLSCRHNYVYRNDEDTLIPNVLLSTETRNYSFISMCIISMLIECSHFPNESSQDYNGYGLLNKSCQEIIDNFKEVFINEKDMQAEILFVLKYLYLRKIICKSVNDSEKIEDVDKKIYIDSQMYLSPRGYEIWKMMESDSVYMELCREDYFFESSSHLNNESSFELMRRNEQAIIFQYLILFLHELLEEEERYLQKAFNHNTLEVYKNYFSKTVLFERFYTGLKKSIMYSGNIDNNKIEKDPIENKLLFLKNRYGLR